MPEENLYPSLNGNDGQHRETEPSGEPQELQPLFEGNGVTITTTTIAPLAGQSLTAANHQTAAAPEPRRKVKFLQKLLNFCGDPKRREQTCSRRNRTLTLCKEIELENWIKEESICRLNTQLDLYPRIICGLLTEDGGLFKCESLARLGKVTVLSNGLTCFQLHFRLRLQGGISE